MYYIAPNMKFKKWILIFKYICITTLLLFSLNGFSKEVLLPNNILHSYNGEDSIYIFTKNKKFIVDLNKYEISKPILIDNNGFNIETYVPFKINETFYFVQSSGGLVLKLEKDKLIRIDHSYDHKMQIGSSIFTYKNEIYRYGGYGFFSSRDFIVKYDFSTNEWEIVNLNTSLIPEPRYDNAYVLDEDNFIILGGKTTNPKDCKNRIHLYDCWKFSIEDRSWHKLDHTEYFKNFNSNFFINADGAVGSHSEKGVYLYDVKESKFDIYQTNSRLIKLNKHFKIHFYNNSFHLVVVRNNNDHALISLTKDELLGPRRRTFKTRSNKIHFLIDVLKFFGVIAIGVILFYVYRFTHFLRVSENKMIFKLSSIEISAQEYRIMQEFTRNNNKIENNRLQKILNKDQYDRSHNIRLKNASIEKLNEKIKYIFNDNSIDFIKVQPSKFDKRYKEYVLTLGKIKVKNK